MFIKQSAKRACDRAQALATITLAVITAFAAAAPAAYAHEAFIPTLVNSSTVPANGDVNPYGVAFVPKGFPSGGSIAAGDVLVSNFNSDVVNPSTGNTNQGTGTTIVQLTPTGDLAPPGAATTFFTSSLTGLSTALGVLRGGFVLVGNVPTTDGTVATIGKGALQIIDRHGKLTQTLTDPVLLDGPWDLTVDDHGASAHVFVSNVLNGTVTRLDLTVSSRAVSVLKQTQIAAGYTHVPNAAAVVLGPTGLAFDAQTGTLYVASTADNAIFAVSRASDRTSAGGPGTIVFKGAPLRGPLALRFAPNGNLLTANGDAIHGDPLHPSEIIEFTKSGHFVGAYNVDASQGSAFGLDTVLGGGAFNYAAVDDATNSIAVYHLPVANED